MDEKLRTLLIDAFKRDALHAGLVDFQAWYHDMAWKNAFSSGARLKDGLHARGIKIAHFMMLHHNRRREAYSGFPFDPASAPRDGSRLTVVPRTGEMVFPKVESDGMTNPAADAYCRDNFSNGVAIYGGVSGTACLPLTILGTFRAAANCDVILATDATNVPKQVPDYIEWVRAQLPPEYRNRLHGATSAEIFAALDQAQTEIADDEPRCAA